MLWLLQHAEAADGQPDDDRPLTERGLRQAESAGRALARLGTNIDACLCSPELGAVQTAQRVCEQIGVEVTIDPALSGEPIDVHGLVAGLGDVLLVGGVPSFSSLLPALTGAQARLGTGGVGGIPRGGSG